MRVSKNVETQCNYNTASTTRGCSPTTHARPQRIFRASAKHRTTHQCAEPPTVTLPWSRTHTESSSTSSTTSVGGVCRFTIRFKKEMRKCGTWYLLCRLSVPERYLLVTPKLQCKGSRMCPCADGDGDVVVKCVFEEENLVDTLVVLYIYVKRLTFW